MSDESFSTQKLLLGRNLRDRGRHDEACSFFMEAITAAPEDAEPYFELAMTQYLMEGKGKDALQTIDRAIQVDPDSFWFHALRALILTKLRKYKEALPVAERAQAMAPDHPFPLRAKAQVHMGMEQWAKAEEDLRRALTLDPDDEVSGNLLATVLRAQNKRWEAERTVEQLLSEDPENPHAHFNAGWSALQARDHKKAEMHFREALRLDADFDPARQGLIESFKARNALYRGHLSWCFWMQKHSAATRWAIIIGLVVGVKIGRELLEKVHPLLALGLALVYMLFVFYAWLASGIGHFLIYLDARARPALKKKEVLDGFFVGGSLIIGLVVLIAGFVTENWVVAAGGGLLTLSTIPASLVFTNDSPVGRILFGALTAVILCSIPVVLLGGQAMIATLVGLAALISFACTWIGQVPFLRQAPEN